jgi:hypothetical protein
VAVIVFSAVMAAGTLLLSLIDMSNALRGGLAVALFGVAAICAYVAVRRLRSS